VALLASADAGGAGGETRGRRKFGGYPNRGDGQPADTTRMEEGQSRKFHGPGPRSVKKTGKWILRNVRKRIFEGVKASVPRSAREVWENPGGATNRERTPSISSKTMERPGKKLGKGESATSHLEKLRKGESDGGGGTVKERRMKKVNKT